MKPPNDKVITGIFGKGRGGKQGGPSTTKQPMWPEVSRGKIVTNSIPNVRAFLDYLGLKPWLNQFANRVRIDGLEVSQYLDAHLLSSLWGQANELGFRPSINFMRHALLSIAVDNGRHPMQEFLVGLRWDGVHRVERLLIDYAHAEDNPLNRAIGKLLLVAMVRRIFEPGCKFDYMPILQGPQGCKKSLFCKTLAGGSEFFEESLTLAADPKKLIENTSGKLVVEFAELAGMTAKDIEHQKALITRTEDHSRLAWGQFTTTAPRQFVIIGTTNDEVFLRDITGNRRYLPVRVSDIDIEALERDRDQLLAEACELEKTYGPLIMPAELTAELLLCQKKVTIIEAAVERLSDHFDDKLSVDPRYAFQKDELFGVMGVTKPTGKDGMVLAQVARQYGLVEKKRGPKEKRLRIFVREKAAETEDG
jgi:predicted P-loop ATPase